MIAKITRLRGRVSIFVLHDDGFGHVTNAANEDDALAYARYSAACRHETLDHVEYERWPDRVSGAAAVPCDLGALTMSPSGRVLLVGMISLGIWAATGLIVWMLVP